MNQADEQERVPYISGAALLARAQRERDELAGLWAGLSELQMLQRPGPQADWSVKDLIVHLTWWEVNMADWVAEAAGGATVNMTEPIDAVNARVFEQNKAKPLPAALREFDAGFQKVADLIRSLSDAQINDAALCHVHGLPLRYSIAGNTFIHYASHRDDLAGYAARLQAGTAADAPQV